jgi:hypothetical protein
MEKTLAILSLILAKRQKENTKRVPGNNEHTIAKTEFQKQQPRGAL